MEDWRSFFVLSDVKTHQLGCDDSYTLLSESNRKNFWYYYLENDYHPLSIKEIFDDVVPLMTDFDFVFVNQNHEPAYNDRFVDTLFTIHQDIIINHLDFSVPIDQRLFGCTLEESIEKLGNGISKLKVHFHFPYVRIERDLVTKFFIPLLIKTLKEKGTMDNMNKKPCESWIDIIKSHYEPLALYGSSNRILTGCYDREDDKCVRISPINLINYTKVEYHSDMEYMDLERFKDLSIEGSFYLPFILSSNFNPPGETYPVDRDDEDPVNYNYFPTTLEMSREFLNMLSQHRATNLAYWISVGKCLYSVTKGTNIGLSLWKQFTQKHSGEGDEKDFDESKYYSKFEGNPLTEKTLAWFASKDNPRAYSIWRNNWFGSELNKTLNDGEIRQTDIAELVYKCFWLKYLCSSYEHKEWYCFEFGTWFKTDGYASIKKDIRKDLIQKLENEKTLLKYQIKDPGAIQDKEFIDTITSKICTIVKLLDYKHLGSPSWTNTVIRESSTYFHRRDVADLMNDNISLMGLSNGIIEAYETGAFFREGTPEDFVSKRVNIVWIDQTMESNYVVQLLNYLREVFPDEELRMHMRKIAAGWIRSGNPYKKFIIFTGDTDASKSIYKKIIETAFGLEVYVFNVPITLFTQKRKSGPSPEMSQGKCAKLLFCQEPDNDETMGGGVVKEVSGGDSQFTRKLYSNGGSIKATFQVIEICNNPPSFLDADQAIKERIAFVLFLSLFKRAGRILTDEEKEKYGEHIYDVDPFFDTKIPDLARAYIWLCVHDFQRYLDEGIEIQPKIVKDYTNNYWETTNMYSMFIAENVEMNLPDDDRYASKEMYKDFSKWFRECYPGTSRIPRDVFMKNIIERIGEPVDGAWRNMREIGAPSIFDAQYR
uniref:D5-like helicase-primase n=1 Tax=Pithovirus LCPAC401 TaxID=2506595 RepID=A0A481ZBC3_9VIRU|nr:MAG: D5-like helicase-primase [Pithovirus LCPAC401]